jgi:hypothetical protein
MCLRRAPEKYITGAMAPVGTALDRAALRLLYISDQLHRVLTGWALAKTVKRNFRTQLSALVKSLRAR